MADPVFTKPVVDVPPAPEPPPFPTLADRRTNTYNRKAYDWALYYAGEFVQRILAQVRSVKSNADAAHERAVSADAAAVTAVHESDLSMTYRNQANYAASTATTQAGNASTSAGQAEASRIEASKINLGAKATAPTVDNQGQVLRVGANYYDTTLNKLRAWTGAAWTDPVNVTAGVKSLNGEDGDLVKTTLAGYGITNWKIETSGQADLNTILTPGLYRFYQLAPNSPPGSIHSILTVTRGEDTGSQSVIDYSTGVCFTRGFVVQAGNNVVWFPWRRQISANEPQIAISGNTIDLSRGLYFTDTVSANKTYNMTNAVPGSSFIAEITHTAGAIAFAAAVFPGSVNPSLTVNRRHLFFFQLPVYNNAWLGSYLGNYPT